MTKTDMLIGGRSTGSATAMLLLRKGVRRLLVEQEALPKVHIGESMAGESAAVLRCLGLEEAKKPRFIGQQ
jgi:2-polyprenyl-6-methoxyphenol hydroxylase-like FAD-dependent oxidoreductase